MLRADLEQRKHEVERLTVSVFLSHSSKMHELTSHASF